MRHAEVTLTYEGKDISKDILPFLQSFQYDEQAQGEADSLAISLTDTDLRWLDAWFPQPGDQIIAKLTSFDWHSPGEVKQLDCGTMQVDAPAFQGPPDVITLKALQIPADQGFSDTPRDSTWQSITMSQLGRGIAKRYGLQFVYDAPRDFTLSAIKRTQQTDAEFLSGLAQKYNLCVKVFSNKLVLYSKARYEKRAPVATITRGASSVQDYSLEAALVGTGFNAVTILYTPANYQTQHRYTYRIAPGGKELVAQESVDDDAQAEMVAQAKLREANEKARTGSFNLALDLDIVAACTVMLDGWGTFDGKYFVDSCSHAYGSSAGMTSIQIHKCLGGSY